MNHEGPFPEDEGLTNPAKAQGESARLDYVARPGRSASPRKSSGGLWSMLGHLIAVALGGVTVFGVYYLFLNDPQEKPSQSAKSSNGNEPSGNQTTPKEAKRPHSSPLESETANPGMNPSVRPADPVVSAETSNIELQAEREVAGERALELARKMQAQNPAAAERWFRKVVTEHKDTKAAQTADDWLKKHAAKP